MAMARKEKTTYVGSGKENSGTQPLHEINIGAARDEHCANIGNTSVFVRYSLNMLFKL
ncbi:hypothetical protein RHMOL_Rhmol01G0218600 [Rhododendron molle]|uniref:Uncharacterized protein n=1 Tax=Rhododendron molle TaxID=49168 RepID=A0ACC0Q4N4_RHOML|nr:hypothetical protein RHMOL_Rhmol01G0218600 [Rhododendron molle]